MTIDRYLVREMTWPFLVGWLLLTAVFAAYVAAELLQDAAAAGLAPTAMWALILLQCVIAWEVIVPTSMFFSVLFAFERMNRDRELIALFAGGWSRARILLPVVGVGVVMVVVVAMLTLQARPWAHRTSDAVEDRATRPDVAAMQAGRFYALGPSLVLTASGIENDQFLQDVFARQQRALGDRVIRAQRASMAPPGADGSQLVEFYDGEVITLGNEATGDRRHVFERLGIRWQETPPAVDEELDRRSRPTQDLQRVGAPREIAELQWRFTLPFITFGMTLIAGVLGTASPGKVTASRMLWAIGAYVVVFNVASAARTALEQGTLPPLPGILWLPLLPLGITVLLLFWLRR